ncbi:hypothetical protein [Enterococcus faecium]|uniref:hypothetical protein n=1 Tax=Enterococcus faecium TaxID=1352 RepID=UPI00215DA56F|nr:hypothetical protein [Enterococcus faecium]
MENHVLETGMQKITTHASITAKPFFEKRGYKVINEQTVELRGQLFTNFLDHIICQIKRDKTFHLRNSKKLLMVFGNLVIF